MEIFYAVMGSLTILIIVVKIVELEGRIKKMEKTMVERSVIKRWLNEGK